MSFVPIGLEEYVRLRLESDPVLDRADLVARLRYALEANRAGVRCGCGERIWVVGSAEAGLACFSCVTGEAFPADDYELAEACAGPES